MQTACTYRVRLAHQSPVCITATSSLHHHHHQGSNRLRVLFVSPFSLTQRAPMEGGRVGRGEGSARRRRERRLRASWRHEQASVSAAVVSALHHSCDVGPVLYEALRGHKKTTEGRWRSTRRTPAYGHRRLLHRGSGRASCRSPGRSGATAPCGAPQGTASRPLACRYWLGRRERQWTLLLSLSSSSLPSRKGRERRRRSWR